MNIEEKWLPVLGYEGFYDVSNMGNVRSVRRIASNGKSAGGRILKVNDNGHGYKNVMLCVNYKTKRKYVHRMVLEAFVGECPEGMEARHLNGKRDDNRIENLEWSTHSDNMWDREKHGTLRHGRLSNLSKLSDHDVFEMRERYATRMYTQQEIAEDYGITQTAVGLIVRGDAWSRSPGTITKCGLGNCPRRPKGLAR